MSGLFCRLQRRSLLLWGLFILAALSVPSPARVAPAAPTPAPKAPEWRAGAWLNSPPLHLAALRGKVVVLEFWTYGWINCIRNLPWVKAWHQKYSPRGLVVVGIHTPETKAEQKLENVKEHVAELGIRHAVAQDNEFASWRAYAVQAWPTVFIIDKQGRVRYRFQGELNWWSEKQHVPFDKILEGLLAERAG